MRLLSEMVEAIANRPFSSLREKIANTTPAMRSSIITIVKKFSAAFDLFAVELSIKNACQLYFDRRNSSCRMQQ